MQTYHITLRRNGINGFLSSENICTDAINALTSIPGIKNLKILRESNEQVELTYSWHGDKKYWETAEHLADFGLARADVK